MIFSYLIAWAVTVAVEVPIVAALYPGQRLRLALACLIATTTTHLAMHFALPYAALSHEAWLVTGETGALLAEALVYALVSRPRRLGIALVASALANSASFLAGLLIW